MEQSMKKKKQNVIIKVEPDSIAEELGIEPGDLLISINGQTIEDVFDYRYLIQEEYLELCIENRDGEQYIAEIEKEEEEDLGILFESGLMDQAKSCRNKCIFCFIDQLPPNMRETLYFKDDDSRLSFLQGNYVTLTNMSNHDIDRLVYYHFSPINISVHTTDLELRKKMLNNKNADRVLEIMERLANAGIEMNLQVVLCNGINDGKFLDKTISDCSAFYPHAKSMSVVPIGLTKYREKLYPMKPFQKENAIQVVEQIENWQKKLKKELGTAFVFASDEFYLKSEIPVPPCSAYEDFSQYENGVGMLALMKQEFLDAFSLLKPDSSLKKTVSIATGKAAFPLISQLCAKIKEKYPNVSIYAYAIENHFFGDQITVSGLLTGTDIINQLSDKKLGDYLLLPDSLLRNGTQTLLDDIEISQIEKQLSIPIRITKNSGELLIQNLLNTEETK